MVRESTTATVLCPLPFDTRATWAQQPEPKTTKLPLLNHALQKI